MATLTIRDLDEALKLKLRLRAASRNRSMEEEARQILSAALRDSGLPANDLGTRIQARFQALGGLQLPLQPREPVRSPPDLAARPARKPAKALPATRKSATRSGRR
jgi:antitoxin FitA